MRKDAGLSSEALFFELAGEDLTQAADLFRPIHQATGGTDGWVSLEVSPLLAHDTARTIEQAQSPRLLLARAKRVGSPHGIAIDVCPVERRHIDGRANLVGKHPA